MKQQMDKIVRLIPKNMYPAGSYVRNKDNPQDIDIITDMKMEDAIKWFENNIGDIYILKNGKKISKFYVTYGKKYIPINIFRAEKMEQIPYMIFSYSYPKTMNIILRKKAKDRGLKLSQYGFFDKNNKLIPIKRFEDVFKKLDIKYRTPEEEEIRLSDKYKNMDNIDEILREIRQNNVRKNIQRGTGYYEDIMNKYREKYCSNLSTKLKNGEKHFLCANFLGPGSDLNNQKNPINEADKCAMEHDIEYSKIMNSNDDEKTKSKKIRLSDKKFLDCINKTDNGLYTKAGKYGIELKMIFEDLFGEKAKKLEGSYYGEK